jgi:hypothetical protein
VPPTIDGPARDATGGGGWPARILTAHPGRSRSCGARSVAPKVQSRSVPDPSRLKKPRRNAPQDFQKMRYFVAGSRVCRRFELRAPPTPPGLGSASPMPAARHREIPQFDPREIGSSTRSIAGDHRPSGRSRRRQSLAVASCTYTARGHRRAAARVRITCEQDRARPCRLASKMHFLIICSG